MKEVAVSSSASNTGQPLRADAVHEEFVRETRELALRRAQVGIILGCSLTVLFMLVDVWRIAPARYPQAVAVRVAGLALLLALLVVARTRNAVRWSDWIAGGVFVVLTATVAAITRLFDGVGDPNYVNQATGIGLCIFGVALMVPFDGPKMLAFGSVALAMHIGFTFDFPLLQNMPVLASTFSAVAIATVGARELARSRRAEFDARRAKEELIRARSDFVAMLTHDIKNPLSVIDGFVQMMREDGEMPSGVREELLLHVQSSVRTAIALAVNFLDASKIEADRFVLRTRMVDLGDLIRGVLSEQRPSAERKGISLVLDGKAELPPLDADAAALTRVLTNLIGNAVKYTPAGGTVRVLARASAEQAEIIVEDTGVGIPSGQESLIFERYTGAASRADSTGLGLFIARTLTAAHGGTIRAENRTDAAGARFVVALPATPADSTNGTVGPGSVRATGQAK
jgi:signal transduction histidine kinase